MAEIMLAPRRGDLLVTKDLISSNLNIFGAKVLLNDTYVVKGEIERHERYGAVASLLINKGARKIMIDARISNDAPHDVQEISNSIIAGYSPKKHDYRSVVKPESVVKPDFLTTSFTAPRKSLAAFMMNVSKLDITPVCFTTSSRYEEQDFRDIGTTSVDYAKSSTSAVSELGFKAVMIAAADAYIVKAENPDLFIFATGGVVDNSENSEHARTALYDETKELVDVFIEGSSILRSNDPQSEYELRFKTAN
jgi:hypothetical protein